MRAQYSCTVYSQNNCLPIHDLSTFNVTIVF